MKNKQSLLVNLLVLALVALQAKLTVSACSYISFGGHCGGKNESADYFKNSCKEIDYSIDGPSQYCKDIDEHHPCGLDACTQKKVDVNQKIVIYAKDDDALKCTSTVITDTGWVKKDTCEQDFIPAGANQCGNCN